MNDLVEGLKEIMKEELMILNCFSENEKLLKQHVHNHDWTGLDTIIKQMQPVSEKIDSMDSKRADIFKSLCKALNEPENSGFYHIAVHFNPEDRKTCSDLYQELKIAVIRIQTITWSIDNYVKTVTGTINQVLENVYPHRKGNIYSSNGNVKQTAGTDPVLINHQL